MRRTTRLWLAPDQAEAFDRAGLRTVADFLALGRAPAIRRERFRSVHRLEGDDLAPCYLKVYAYPILEAWLREAPRLRRPRLCGVTEATNIQRIAALGVDVPPVLACGGGRVGMWHRSFVLTAAVPGEPLDGLLERCWPDTPEARRREWLRALATRVRRLHDAGIFHRDLYLCHWIFAAPIDDVVPPITTGHLTLLDLHRAEPRRWFRRRWQIKDLAAMEYSALQAGIPLKDRLRFLYYYLPPDARRDWERWMWAIERKRNRLARHGRKG